MSMFCFQCEQTAFQKGCTIRGVCGKTSDTSNIQDEIIESVFELVFCNKDKPKNDDITFLIIKSLFSTMTNVNFDDIVLSDLNQEIKKHISCDFKFDIKTIFNNESENIKSLKSLVLFGLKGMAAYVYHAWVLGFKDEEINSFFYEALSALEEEKTIDELVSYVLKVGSMNLKALELLDSANTKTYGDPVEVKVSTNVEKGPFIVVSGHDLKDLEIILEQTKDKGINIYTHGEMLPCHSYPKLKKYSHLKGNFGTAWQNQQKEFDSIPAPVVFTTNCIMPIKESYMDRVFTTSVVGYSGAIHIDEKKDFSIVIKKALELKGYKEDKNMTGINGGSVLSVGFGHKTILDKYLSKIVELIKAKKLRHIFVVGGCDGARTGRNYYTKFVELVPKDSIVMTLACGKYRFNDLELGYIEDVPRLFDLGQCNDSFTAVKFVIELAKALDISVDELPIHFVLSWYEQKAVCVLLSLFALEIRNIKLGPTLPAFISKDILNFLVEKYKIKPITTPNEDLNEILSKN